MDISDVLPIVGFAAEMGARACQNWERETGHMNTHDFLSHVALKETREIGVGSITRATSGVKRGFSMFLLTVEK